MVNNLKILWFYSSYFVLDEAILLDLKHLLIEAKQPVPPFLLQLESDKERLLDIGGKKKPCFFSFPIYLIYILDEPGCSYCNGLGHRITNCPKLESQHNKTANNMKKNDFLAKGNSDWWSIVVVFCIQ